MNPVRRDALPVLVAEEIKRDIVHGRFKPGAKLPSEVDLGRALGVGRPTVREALRILQGEGWIHFKFSGGAHVMDPGESAHDSSVFLKREELVELLDFELAQCEGEGRHVPTGTREACARLKNDGTPKELDELYSSVARLEPRADFPYAEPSDLEAIRTESDSAGLPTATPTGQLEDRLHAAWLGRCIGCLTGKPVEGWSHEDIVSYLRATSAYPLGDYIPFAPEQSAGGECSVNAAAREQTRGNVTCMPADDDIDYTILNLELLEKYGRAFTTEDVGESWLSRLPYHSTYSAERQAYANLVRGLQAPATATYRNPFREWIGATIRADVFGYACPGDPLAASTLAFRDARLSHVRNGIYGEMFVAAVIASALATGDLEGSLRAGRSVVPRRSRLAEVLETVAALPRQTASWEEAFKQLRARYGHFHHTHTLTNVGVTALALLYGDGDLRATVSIAVMCGWDTDCNGATAGSIVGALRGTAGIPADLGDPLHDRARTTLSGLSELSIRALARRTAVLARATAGAPVAAG